MNKKDILLAYREGLLDTGSAQRVLDALRERSASAPLSSVEQGIWATQRAAPGSTAYHVPVVLHVARALDIDALRRACLDLALAFPILTSTIVERDGEPRRAAFSSAPAQLRHERVGALSDDALAARLADAKREPFDLRAGPLWRLFAFERGRADFVLMLVVHHLSYDGASTLPLVDTLLAMHDARAAGATPAIEPFAPAHDAYVADEARWLASADAAATLDYWRRALDGAPPALELPLDRPRPAQQTFNGKVVQRALPEVLGERAAAFAAQGGLTRAALFLAVFKLLLSRYAAQDDIVVGVPVSRRPLAARGAVGNFVNLLPLRSRVDARLTFAAFAAQVQGTLNAGRDHAAYPFPELVKRLNVPRDAALAPVFQALFAYQNFAGADAEAAFCARHRARFLQIEHQAGESEIGVEVFERASASVVHLKFNPDLFDDASAARMLDHFVHLLDATLADPRRPLADYPLVTPAERERIVSRWNATAAPYPDDRCLHELVDEHARTRADARAVSDARDALGFGELKRRSDAIAAALVDAGAAPRALVGVCMTRSVDLLAALIGVMKAGAAYVPLDPRYPDARLRAIVDDAQLEHVLTDAESAPVAAPLCADGARVMLDAARCAAGGSRAPLPRATPDDLAYVIYTSGSTGKPKGVMVPHRAVVNLLCSMARAPGMAAGERMLALATYAFDMSVPELFLPLAVGGECMLAQADAARDPRVLMEAIAERRPTIMQITPTACAMLFEAGWRNAERVALLCGAEPLTETVRRRLAETGTRAWNMYGPTETTVWSTMAPIAADRPITLGAPLANTRVYIVDGQDRLLPPGLYGEMVIAGDGVARGYLGRPELSAERFVRDPFVNAGRGANAYRTGDIARWRDDGSLEFAGRSDAQVKLRGFRIELGDIEAHLKRHPAIEDAVAVVNEAHGLKRLVGYVVVRGGAAAPSWSALRSWLLAALPAHMVPACYEALPAVPLTPNGKIDRRGLAARPLAAAAGAQAADGLEAGGLVGGLEGEVLALWRETLKVGDIGPTDGFFDAGGDSILAVALAARIEQRFGVTFSATTLFKYACVRDIAGYIASAEARPRAGGANARAGVEAGAAVATPPGRPAGEAAGAQRDRAPRAADERADAPPAAPSDAHASKAAAIDSRGGAAGGDGEPARAASHGDAPADGLAIIGIALRVPGAADARAFWRNLREGRSALERLDARRLMAHGVASALAGARQTVGVRATIADKHRFDAEFFGVSMRDAALMDPQARQLLQHAWLAFEDAGYVPADAPDTAVFVSASHSRYAAKQADGARAAAEAVLDDPADYVGWILEQGGTIPALISYKLGLTGPSLYVHTNCSSSLAALYAAWQTIRAGDAKQALVAAATLFADERLGYVHQPGLNFSSDGRIKTFDRNADGMVPGEGVVAVLVKRVAEALADGDRIYAIVRDVALNNDGAAKAGFYAPSVRGQAQVIDALLRRTGVRAADIVYVEAHGTGTQIGDPIEVAALTDAYRAHGAGTGHCGLGSVKTNVGHLDTAAGLVGLVKVALSLEQRMLPPSLNFDAPNPALDLASSPFYVVERATPIAPRAGRTFAAVSAFGVGGTNAHALVEAHRDARDAAIATGATGAPDVPDAPDAPDAQTVVPLSAKTPAQLTQRAAQLLDALRGDDARRPALADVAFTLQRGRQPMGSRAAFVVDSIDMLCEQLAAYVAAGGAHAPRGAARADATHAHAGDAHRLAERWVAGDDVDWRALSRGGRRIGLPGYPFGGDVYGGARDAHDPSRRLHPLLHRNVSTLSQVAFTSTFDGGEPFLRDHLLHGRRVLPGAAYLEMIHAAAERALAPAAGAGAGVALANVVWVRPVEVVDASVTVRLAFAPADDDGLVAFEIRSETAGGGGALHCRGHVQRIAEPAPGQIDLHALRERCAAPRLSAARCYETYARLGLDYGPSHRGVVDVRGEREHLLARIVLAGLPDADARPMHAGLVDSAFQATLAAVAETPDELERLDAAPVPFALGRLDVLAPCAPQMWASIRVRRIGGAHADGGRTASDDALLAKIDIDLVDDAGNVCVRVRDLAARRFVREPARAPSRTLAVRARWRGARASGVPGASGGVPREVVLVGVDARAAEPIRAALGASGVACEVWPIPADADPAGQFAALAARVLERLQAAVRARPTSPRLLQLVSLDDAPWFAAALAAMLKTAALEQPCVLGQQIALPSRFSPARIAAALADCAAMPDARRLRFGANDADADGALEVETFAELDAWPEQAAPPWKAGGVYLVTGGGGRIARRLIDAIAAHAANATVVVASRTQPGAARADARHATDASDTPHAPGVTVDRIALDVTDGARVRDAVRSIVSRHGRLDGVLHGAGVLDDDFILNKDARALHAVIAPKAQGAWHLDAATASLDLDCFVLFSSVAGALGNAGQVDYSGANAFMDAFAHWRRARVAAGERRGRTVSIGWPLWAEGGMRIDDASLAALERSLGMRPMPTPAAIGALYAALACGESHVVLFHGDPAPLRRAAWLAASAPTQDDPAAASIEPAASSTELPEMNVQATAPADAGARPRDDAPAAAVAHAAPDAPDAPDARPADAAPADDARLTEHALALLKRLLSTALHTPASRLDAHAPLERYGIDSIVVVSMNGELEKAFGSLSKTLFFEYRTLHELACYFVAHHRERLARLLPAGHGARLAPASAQPLAPRAPSAEPARDAARSLEPEQGQGQGQGQGQEPEPASQTAAASESARAPAQASAHARRERAAPETRTQAPAQAHAKTQASAPDAARDAFDIAIVGLAGRYPGADSVDAFWANLRDGRDCVTEVPAERWDHARYFHPDKAHPGTTYAKWGGFVDGVDRFDAAFFNMSPREAAIVDPQERLFLETVYEAIEDAGYTPRTLAGGAGRDAAVGVYVGVMYQEYQLYGAQASALGEPCALPSSPSSIANRVSFFCDFDGPSIAVDTMCSSSLTAIHLACQSLRSGECAAAVAGGVNLTLHPNKYLLLSFGRFASSKGRCESFGAGGDGYVPAEGVGAVVLKPLARARADGDHVYGVIKGSALNHGGRTNGFTVPNPASQRRVILRALREAGVDPRRLGYVEAHGTGTSLGDPIEIDALSRAFAEFTQDKQFCPIGSVKSNIGHAESAAGVAALTKVLMQLKHDTLAPSLHADVLNPNIDFAATPFYVQRERADWPPAVDAGEAGGVARRRPRVCAVSSFGAGGSNAHLIVEEYVASDGERAVRSASDQLVVLSARSPEQLREQARRLRARLLADAGGTPLDALAYTLQVGREAMAYRFATIVATRDALAARLDALANDALFDGQALPGDADGFAGRAERDETLVSLARDDAFRDAVGRWVAEGQLARLAQLWVRGVDLDWTLLHRSPPARISLPTYPFKRDRHWGVPNLAGLPGAAGVANVAGVAGAAGPAGVEHAASGAGAASVASAAGAASAASTASTASRAGTPSPAVAASTGETVAAPASHDAFATAGAKPGVVLAPATAAGYVATPRPKPTVMLDTDAAAAARARPGAASSPSPSSPSPLPSSPPRMSSRQHASPAAAPDPRAALLDIEAFLAGSLAAALMATTDEIDREQTFNALGVDSIVGVEWVRAINDRYGTALPATVIYDHPSVRAMARHVSSNATPGVAGVARGDASAPQAAPSAFAAAASSASGAVSPAPFASAAPPEPPASPARADGALDAAGATSLDAIRAHLVDSLAQALYVEPAEIGVDQPFAELGLDSIVGVEWITAVNRRFGTALPAVAIYDHPSVVALARFVGTQLGARLPAAQAARAGAFAGVEPGEPDARALPAAARAAAPPAHTDAAAHTDTDALLRAIERGELDAGDADAIWRRMQSRAARPEPLAQP
ncbi:non-ribosomal peptide synthetase [Burkholderia thailandensis]|uniref:non-ribosomal peptide synthetase n=2 Tax=Burkholderia thailandensis TaxID=57975 RepID=UPI000A6AC8C8|nr:non-ribosomal peptide synthetase [Burkholderia thailandensis]